MVEDPVRARRAAGPYIAGVRWIRRKATEALPKHSRFQQARLTLELKELNVGDRVQMHPATDCWMRGDKFAEVLLLARSWVRVRFDRDQQVVDVNPRSILEVL